jgi:hypothetical protein
MRQVLLATATAVSLLPAATPSRADESPLWETVGSWQVRVDPSLGQGCFMLAHYTTGETLRIGIDATHKANYMVVLNPAWTSLELGKTYPLAVSFNGGTAQAWNGSPVKFNDGTVAIAMPFTNGQFWSGVAAYDTMELYYQGAVISKLRLTGTVKAVQSVTQCQASFNAAAKPADPFVGVPHPANVPPPAKRDPFAA